MRNLPGDPRESPLLGTMTEHYRDSAVAPSRAELDRGLDLVLSRLACERPPRLRILRWSLVGGAVALAAIVILQVTSAWRSPPVAEPALLAYHVVGGSVLEGGYLRESGNLGVKVLFNEGSSFALAPGTRGRIRSIDGQGARVTVDSGLASLEVTPNLKRRWFVDVGPFEVTVKGTAFSVSWDPLDERFELDLRHGRVLVRGPVSAGEITMRGGQRLVVSLPKAEAVLTEGPQKDREPAMAPTAEGSDHSPPQAEAATPAEAPLPRVLTPSRGGKLAGTHRWRDDLARGEWDRILDEVKRIGVEATLAKASSDDLFAVADAARYRRHSDLARAALLSVRRRFPEAPRALNALYLLGRVEESRQGGVTEAIAWYDEYLSHVPTGALAGEALGRKMVLTERAQGGARARPIAEEYLRRFSSGSYAASARALSGVPGQGP